MVYKIYPRIYRYLSLALRDLETRQATGTTVLEHTSHGAHKARVIVLSEFLSYRSMQQSLLGRRHCLSRTTCLLDSVRLEQSHLSMEKRLNCTGKRNDSNASSQQAKQMPVMYGDSRSNEPPSIRTRKLLGNLPRFRLPARASQRNEPTYGSGAMVTLANISSSKQPIQGPVEHSVKLPVLSLAHNVFCRAFPDEEIETETQPRPR